MELPDFIRECLHKAPAMFGHVQASIATFQPILDRNEMPFFTDYTEHGMRHNEDIIKTSLDLMTKEAKGIFSPADATILVLSVLLHDCAMHISVDGFLSLKKDNSRWKPLKYFNDKPWDTLWDEFMANAMRYDGRTLISLFGDTEPVARPPDNPQNMTKKHRLLIGEFLRKHHARLAHEIAIYGFPGPEGQSLDLLPGLEQEWRDLAGVTARSHGVAIRDCLEFFKNKYHIRDFRGAHTVFVMALLRLADYCQIQAQRAPRELIEIKNIRSPISETEWHTHQCIRNITPADDDPEAVYVDAAPAEVATYLRVKNWLVGIQNELD
ncbi:MAG: hypothetical protein HQL87_15830 [Magnetococcales bacterium]|nr:hypothetical protein [Magnetococcales bacterium]